MIRTCPRCGGTYDDEFRWTICPHETFAANDGKNNFAHHPESFISVTNGLSTAQPGRNAYWRRFLRFWWDKIRFRPWTKGRFWPDYI